MTAETLTALAKKHCRPASLGAPFQVSPATATLREIARAGRDAEAWKHYLSQLRQEKTQWKGDEYMISSTSTRPVEEIKEHFETVFHDELKGDIYQELKRVGESLDLTREVTPFNEQEVREAIMKGKNGKATGPDCIPTTFLKV